MKTTHEITINLPRPRVLDLIMDPANFPKWQPGVKAFQLLSGAQGQPGARAKVVIESHGLKLDMVETIVERRLPDVYTLRYEGKGVKNIVENRFYEDGPDRTRWVLTNTVEVGLMMAMAAPVINEIIGKQNHDSMKAFKAFAEQS
jgi:carbon monoxide dehydrogenase subunit G